MFILLSDLRRAVKGRWFLIAVFASAVVLWASADSPQWGIRDLLYGAGDGDSSELAAFLHSALQGPLGLLLLPALSALPYGAQALYEIRSGAFRPAIFRAGKTAYIAGLTLACAAAGMLAQLFAFALLAAPMGLASFLLADGQWLPLEAIVPCLRPLLGRMLLGGGWAMLGHILALVTETASAAIIAPLCLCYALTMTGTRFFPDLWMLSPLNWQDAPLLAQTLILAALGIAAVITQNREVQKHV